MKPAAWKRRPSAAEILGWGLLCTLLLATLFGAVRFDREGWPGLVGDEATYLMAAESLAWDHDIRYTRADFDRFIDHWSHFPDGLILQSGDGGETLTFGKPFFYSLYVAPFTRFLPSRGPFVANALLLALTGLLVARSLETRLGAQAPVWAAVFLFGSVTFAYVFWAHADLFLMCLTAIALALATDLRGRDDSNPGKLLRWFTVGGLLGVVAFSRPFYLPLLLAGLFAVPLVRRRRFVAYVLGAVAVVMLAAGVHRAQTGSWTAYGGERRAFYNHTGFPEVDFPAREWSRAIEELGNAAWGEASNVLGVRIEPRLLGWNAVYFTVGRHVGILPYFLPLLLGLLLPLRGRKRWAFVIAVALAALAFFAFRPFNFWGGGSSLANRYFLPLYPAFWFLASRPLPRLVPVAVAIVAGMFLWPLWTAPGAHPLTERNTYRWVTPTARRMLPYETTQSHLKPGGQEDVNLGDVWIKFLDTGVRPAQEERLLLVEPAGRLLVGSGSPIRRLEARFRAEGDVEPRLGGGRIRRPEVRAGEIVLALEPPKLKASHAMWWQRQPFYLYEVKVAAPGTATPVRFELSRD